MIHACVIEDSGRDFEKSFPFIKCMEQDLYGRRRPNISDVAKKVWIENESIEARQNS